MHDDMMKERGEGDRNLCVMIRKRGKKEKEENMHDDKKETEEREKEHMQDKRRCTIINEMKVLEDGEH